MVNENNTINKQTDTEVTDKEIALTEPIEPSGELMETTDENIAIVKKAEVTVDENLVVKAKSKKPVIIAASIAVLVIALAIYLFIFSPMAKYNKANDLVSAGKYDEAISVFKELGDYKDSKSKLDLCHYEKGLKLIDDRKYDDAISIFKKLGNYKDSKDKFNLCTREKAFVLIDKGKYIDAKNILTNLDKDEEIAKSLRLCNHMILYNHMVKNGTPHKNIYYINNPDTGLSLQIDDKDKTIRAGYERWMDSSTKIFTILEFQPSSYDVAFSYFADLSSGNFEGEGIFYPQLYDGNLDNTTKTPERRFAVSNPSQGLEIYIDDVYYSPYMDLTFHDSGNTDIDELIATKFYVDFSTVLKDLSNHIDYINCGVNISDFGIILK